MLATNRPRKHWGLSEEDGSRLPAKKVIGHLMETRQTNGKGIMTLIGRTGRLLMAVTFSMSLLIGALVPNAGGTEVRADYLYNLADFSGTVPYNTVMIHADNFFNEVYVVSGNRVDVFNWNGMSLYDFFLDYPAIYTVVVEPAGGIIALVNIGGKTVLLRCNYRGEPLKEIGFTGFPAEFAGGSYSEMRYRNGRLYLTDLRGLKVVATDLSGAFVKGYDLSPPLTRLLPAKELADAELGGVDIDQEGNILFTLPNKGLSYRLAADGTLASFGRRGSGPGRYGVPWAVAVDRMGNIFVCDKLRCVVLVFDKTLKYVYEFGFRGLGPGNLIVPIAIEIGDNDRAYVGQLLSRGVSVYKLSYN
jgi:hypothetical protein